MKFTRSVKLLSLFFIFSRPASASDYPPDYVVDRNCEQYGPIEVCALNQRYGLFPRLKITYTGSLLDSSADSFKVYVKFNGRDSVFEIARQDHTATTEIGAPRNIARGLYGWTYSSPTPEEQWLLFYARNSNGIANAWDVELAFLNSKGEWDSNFSKNYTFRFNP